MRLILQGGGCLVALLGSIIGIGAVFGVLNTELSGAARVVWGLVAVATIGGSWLIFDRLGRQGAAWDAQRSESPGEQFGTKVRSYRGAGYDTVIGSFQRDAKSLAANGYGVINAGWQSLKFRKHPIRYIVLTLVGILTGTLGEGGTLSVTYEPGSTTDAALSTLKSWTRRLRESAAAGELGADAFADLPFEMTLPPAWEPDDNPPGIPADLHADAVFFARDPQSTDPDYSSTVLVMASEPANDPHGFLDRQEAELRSGSTRDSATFARITLPAGEALLVQGVLKSHATIQYYLPTTLAKFAIWFTAPVTELPTREPEFEAIARSFRLK